MASIIQCEVFPESYAHILNIVMEDGRGRTPRGLNTRDLGHTIIEIDDPTRTLAINCGRGLSMQVAAIEALQLVGEQMDEDLLIHAAPHFKNFLDDGEFHGAYGRRVRGQVYAALRKLATDHDTRQAVITIWDPALDNLPGKHDYPCTVAIGLECVYDVLDMRVLMRSNDAWLGLPYDVFAFSQLQCTLANALSLRPGSYTHETWSLHLYESDWDKIDRVHGPTEPVPQLDGVGEIGLDYPTIRAITDAILHDLPPFTSPTATEMWFAAQLEPLFPKRQRPDAPN